MDKLKKVLSADEWTALNLRALYAENGYEKYRMSKFEEYDLYARNKDFLVSDSVITFTDTDGKLLALKPDVTLSIIKNAKPQAGKAMKVYYHENVYRVSKGTRAYKELAQAGLECLGDVSENDLTEVVYLAAKSLDAVSERNVLELSELTIVDGVIRYCGLDESARKALWLRLAEKNLAGVQEIAKSAGVSELKSSLLQKLVTTYGSADCVLPQLDVFRVSEETAKAVDAFKGLILSLQARGIGEKLRVDFSVLGDMNYYNGLAFKGFVEGLPTWILSGGRYDKLMAKMGKQGKAVGFAVYLDEIAKLKA